MAGSLIIGSVLGVLLWFILAGFLTASRYRQLRVGSQNLFLVVYIICGILFGAIYAFPSYIVYSVYFAAHSARPYIRVETGDIAGFCLGVVSSAFCMALFASLTAISSRCRVA
jgi:hypothetical protein